MKRWQELPQEDIFLNIGHNLKELRISYNYSQKDLAKKTDLSRSTIQRIERGKSLNFDSIIRIFRVYGKLDLLQNIFVKTRNISPVEILKKLNDERR